MLDFYGNTEAIDRVKETDAKLHEELNSDNSDGKRITRLMFEQMLRGLYLTNPSSEAYR